MQKFEGTQFKLNKHFNIESLFLTFLEYSYQLCMSYLFVCVQNYINKEHIMGLGIFFGLLKASRSCVLRCLKIFSYRLSLYLCVCVKGHFVRSIVENILYLEYFPTYCRDLFFGVIS